MKLDPYMHQIQKWTKDLKLKAKTIRCLKQAQIFMTWNRQWFLRYDTKAPSSNRKNRWFGHQIKKFCASKETIKKWKYHPQNGGKIANYLPGKGPVIQNIFFKTSNKKTTEFLKIDKGSQQTFHQRYTNDK